MVVWVVGSKGAIIIGIISITIKFAITIAIHVADTYTNNCGV